MPKTRYPVTGKVEIFQVQNPWVYLRVPQEYTLKFSHITDRGLVPVTVTLGRSTWDTSLMPMGDGTQFIPLNRKVRKAESIDIGGHVELVFILRNREKA